MSDSPLERTIASVNAQAKWMRDNPDASIKETIKQLLDSMTDDMAAIERELADARAELSAHKESEVAFAKRFNEVVAERDALLMALRGQKIALSLMLERYSDGETCRMPVNYLRTQAECIDAAIDAAMKDSKP